ncbi:transposase [Nibrella viscosa]|uniref:Transposase n=1 Tax=Nibrella viscosa TaxID=1084524 RepID=A0ABP8L395_9BACT
MSIEAILKPILAKLSNVNKHQRSFLTELFAVLLGRQGRATFENLARYSRFTELTFRRQFASYFDWLAFNKACIDFTQGSFIGLVDCSFLPKSGTKTFGLDKFWSSCAGKAQRGLEVSVLACVNTLTKECFALEASQTPPDITQQPGQAYSRLSWYLEQLADCLSRLPVLLYWVADGYYAKKEVFQLFASQRRHLITRLRHDAALYHLWIKGRQPGQRGPTRRYDGKASFDDLSRWQDEGVHPIHSHIRLFSALLYSKHFERTLRVVLLLDSRHQKYVLLASTDQQQLAQQIAQYYHLRFQIELLFRDAKQFTGLHQCQARSDAKLDYHLNATLSAVNIGRLLLAADASLQKSMNALVRRQTNQRIWTRIYHQLSQEGLVDVNRLDRVDWQFWQRRAA